MDVSQNPWVFCSSKNSTAQLRLFLFHHAGGTATIFKQWIEREYFPENFEVIGIDLPGRGNHANRKPQLRMLNLIQEMATVLRPLMDAKPYAFFGHSLGGMVAYELAKERWKRGESLPCHIIVSACSAPCVDPLIPLHEVEDDDEFIRKVAERYKMDELIDIMDIPQFRESNLHLMRADMELFGTFFPVHETDPIPVSISAYGGQSDAVNPASALELWSKYTTKPFLFKSFDGGHFYFLDGALHDLVNNISLELEPKLAAI